MNPLSEVRALRALNLRRRGALLKDVAKELGVTKERVRQMERVGAEIERRMFSEDPWDELSTRTRNALVGDGCDPTPEAVSARYVLDPHLKTGLPITRVLNIGTRSIAEIQRWLVRHGKLPLP
jgi:hypothetical protein